MLGKLTKIALLGGLVLLATTVLAASAFAQTTAYGLIYFTAQYNMTNSPNYNGDLGLPAVPARKDTLGGAGTFIMQAEASRIGVKSSMDTDMGKVTGVVEVDAGGRAAAFAASSAIGGESSAAVIRLRQAYVSVGNLLVGRTWGGLVTDFSWAPNVWDPEGPYGYSVVFGDPRMPQVRYTVPIGANKFVISAEQVSGVRAGIAGEASTSLPRLVPAFYMDLGMAKVQVVAAMTSFRYNESGALAGICAGPPVNDCDGNGKTTDDLTTSGTAFGVNASVNVGDAGNFKFHFLTGGAGNQINAITILASGTSYYNSAAAGAKPSLSATSGTDILLGYNHKLAGGANITFAYGSVALADAKAAYLGAANITASKAAATTALASARDSGTSMSLNYEWPVATGLKMVVEYDTKTIHYMDIAATEKNNSYGAAAPKSESASHSSILFGTQFAF
jgi:hypothetical protein